MKRILIVFITLFLFTSCNQNEKLQSLKVKNAQLHADKANLTNELSDLEKEYQALNSRYEASLNKKIGAVCKPLFEPGLNNEILLLNKDVVFPFGYVELTGYFLSTPRMRLPVSIRN